MTFLMMNPGTAMVAQEILFLLPEAAERGGPRVHALCRHRGARVHHQERHQRHPALPVHDGPVPARPEEHVRQGSARKHAAKNKTSQPTNQERDAPRGYRFFIVCAIFTSKKK